MVVVKKKKQGSPIELTQDINYKDIKLIKLFITRYGRIVPRRRSSLTVKQQKNLKKATGSGGGGRAAGGVRLRGTDARRAHALPIGGGPRRAAARAAAHRRMQRGQHGEH